ncbi:Cof-type HAD-IIB family hydrolase [Sediminibacillus dalangtanensis]|nr:Cof-type HAD-IIB family hydrolase [Sediminibacillus dalangtanensis]
MVVSKLDIKLIALDMDGTLLNSNEEVSEANRKAITAARNNGVEVVLSTGRHRSSCEAHAVSLNLSSYLITVNGSEIWTSEGELVSRQSLDIETIKKLVDLNERYGTRAWMASTEKVFRGEFPADLEGYEWLKVGIDIDSEEVKNRILEELEGNDLLELSNSHPMNIEINAVGINKARALEKICGLMGITLDQVMTVGDSLNDIKMIQEAGLGVAMGNAQEEVKQTADWVTTDNNHDGVAKAIEHWIL